MKTKNAPMKKTTKSLADETNCLTKRNQCNAMQWFNLSYQIELTPFWSNLVLQSLLRSSSWVPEEIGLEMLTFTFFFLYLCFQLHTDTQTDTQTHRHIWHDDSNSSSSSSSYLGGSAPHCKPLLGKEASSIRLPFQLPVNAS